MALKKRLQKLPPKETGKSREEALELLTEDIQSAFKKGYSLSELRGICSEEGVRVSLKKVVNIYQK